MATAMRALVTAALVALLACGLVATSGAQSARAGTGIPATVRAKLLALAERDAKVEGDAHPFDIEAVATTRGKALSLQHGDTEPACEESSACMNTPFYVVAMRGRFVCNSCSPPLHARTPKGTVITLEVEVPNMWAGGFGMSDSYPKLQKIGTVVHLRPRRQP